MGTIHFINTSIITLLLFQMLDYVSNAKILRSEYTTQVSSSCCIPSVLHMQLTYSDTYSCFLIVPSSRISHSSVVATKEVQGTGSLKKDRSK